MTARDNLVNLPPRGLIIAVQMWPGDVAAALRLARLLSDIEPKRRDDVTLAFCRRFDLPLTPEIWEASMYCGQKFCVAHLESKREATGHPDGSFGLWAGALDQLAASWRRGEQRASAVFMAEADGVPLRRDWIDVLLSEHAQAIRSGKRITGDLVGGDVLHVNGSCILELAAWIDHPSLHETPPGQAFDLYHAPTLIAECRPTRAITNLYGGQKWSDEALKSVAKYSAWMLNCKDTSGVEWAERVLVTPSADQHGGGHG